LPDVILGSGIVGCIAKYLHPDAIFIPYKKSRYYSFEFPFADNLIGYSTDIDNLLVDISPRNKIPVFNKHAMSFEGQLSEGDINIKEMYLKKVYETFNDYAPKLVTVAASYYPMTVIELYEHLQKGLIEEINKSKDFLGVPKQIDVKNKQIIFGGQRVSYDRIISTIPLDALLPLCKMKMDLKSKSICFFRIASNTVNLEGNYSCFVADEIIDFFKVVQLAEHEHMFWTFDVIENPYQYFGKFLTYNIEILEAFRIENAIPIGNVPDLSELEKYGIYCVGSNAQWDDFMDVSSCMKRLLRLFGKK
jgi:hypothetical protein